MSVTGSGNQATGGASGIPSISADGRFVAFVSGATNLVSADTNGRLDAFVRDRQLGTTTRVSVASGGGPGSLDSFDPIVSADGRYVAFTSDAPLQALDTNFAADVFRHDLQLGSPSGSALGQAVHKPMASRWRAASVPIVGL